MKLLTVSAVAAALTLAATSTVEAASVPKVANPKAPKLPPGFNSTWLKYPPLAKMYGPKATQVSVRSLHEVEHVELEPRATVKAARKSQSKPKSKSTSSKSTAKSTPTPSKTASKGIRAPPGKNVKPAAIAAAATGGAQRTSNMNTFCSKYKQACIDAAMKGRQAGEAKIEVNCKKAANNINYEFGCKVNDVDVGQRALNNMGTAATITRTVIVGTETSTVTTQALATSTSFATSTTPGTTVSLEPTTVVTSTTTTSPVVTPTEVTSTITSLETSTITDLAPTTTTSIITTPSTTTTQTSVAIGDVTYPVTYYVISIPGVAGPPGTNNRRETRLDPSSFCTAYGNSCATACTAAKSSPRHNVCALKDPTAGMFSLTCICKNGLTRTQTALAAVDQQSPEVTILSTVTTKTVTATETSTMVIPSTIFATSLTTVVAYTPVTSTAVSTVLSTTTSTATTTTATTTTATPHTTVTPTITTSTTTAYGIATTSTIFAVAPTGTLVAKDLALQSTVGYVNGNAWTGLNARPDNAAALMIVRDPASGLYAFADTQGNHLLAEGDVASPVLAAGSADFALLQLTSPVQTAAGPAAGSGPTYGQGVEDFVFEIRPSSANGIEVLPVWTNGDGSRATSLNWLGFQESGITNYIGMTGDAQRTTAQSWTDGTGTLATQQLRFFLQP